MAHNYGNYYAPIKPDGKTIRERGNRARADS